MTNIPIYPVGSRVYHDYQKWPGVQHRGTATVVGHEWIGDHLEYLVCRDESLLPDGSADAKWAYYRTNLAGQ